MPRCETSGGSATRALRPLGDPGAETTANVGEGLSTSLVRPAGTCGGKTSRTSGGERATSHTEEDGHGVGGPGESMSSRGTVSSNPIVLWTRAALDGQVGTDLGSKREAKAGCTPPEPLRELPVVSCEIVRGGTQSLARSSRNLALDGWEYLRDLSDDSDDGLGPAQSCLEVGGERGRRLIMQL